MENITQAIRDASSEVWDSNIRNNEYWRQNNLLNEHGDEIYRQTLYVHVMKNDSSFDIYDNNGKINSPGGRNGNKNPKIICQSNSYMIKFGKTDNQKDPSHQWKGIINRRQDDFKNHYHTREDINHPYKISLNPNNENNSSSLRVGSSSSILHLIINLNGKTSEEIMGLENQLKIRFSNRFINEAPDLNSTIIPTERINITTQSVTDENQLLTDIKDLFLEFENECVVN